MIFLAGTMMWGIVLHQMLKQRARPMTGFIATLRDDQKEQLGLSLDPK
jgi:hypothetical protein